MANRPLMRERACAQCGISPISGYKFCSDTCCQKSHNEKKARAPGRVEYVRLRVREWKARQVARRPPVTCPNCGNCFHGAHGRKKFCSAECRADHVAKISKVEQPPARDCPQCGKRFQPFRAGITFCTPECEKRRRRRINDPIRRARKRKATVERFDPLEILERDKWRCHICGIKTPKRLRGTFEPNAPELDHIIPLVAGGEHSRKNTACACRACNIRKGGKPLGQMRMIG